MLFYHIKTSGVDSNLFNENYKVTKRKKAKQMRAVSVCVCVCVCVCEKCVLIIHFKISLVLVSFVHLIFMKKAHGFLWPDCQSTTLQKSFEPFFLSISLFPIFIHFKEPQTKKPQTKSKLVAISTENVWSTTDFDEFLYAEILANFTIKMSICAKQM